MVMLLSSRGRARRSRSGSSILGTLRRAAYSLFGATPQSRRDPGPSRGANGTWLALGLALLCFGAGFLVGGRFGGGVDDADLRARTDARRANPRTPEVIGQLEPQKLTNAAFLVAVYDDADQSAAFAKAQALSQFLVDKGLPRTRPYQWSTNQGPLWAVAVYYDGLAEQSLLRSKLLALDEVPDAAFRELRAARSGEGTKNDWPVSRVIQ
jgi:hypothetical protein